MLKMLLGFLLAVSMLMPSLGCQTMDELKTGLRMTFGIGADVEPTPSPFDIKRAEEEARMEPEVEPADELIWLSEEPRLLEEVECEDCRSQSGRITVEVQRTGKENIDPARFPTDIKATMKQVSEWGDLSYNALDERNFKYALLPQDGDFSRINTDYWEEIYWFPYNLYNHDFDTGMNYYPDYEISDAEHGFKTNVECLELYGEEVLIECINLARKNQYGAWSQTYLDKDKNMEYARAWGETTGTTAGLNYVANAGYDNATKDQIVMEADFATDISLVYQDALGHLRVRGTTVYFYEHVGSESYGVESGDWGFIVREVIIEPGQNRMTVIDAVDLSQNYGPAVEQDRATLQAVFDAMPPQA